jgi:predicted DNA-binding transcriptional regulator YafY
MGRRSGTETVVGVVAALLEERTWEQAELARRVGVTTRTLRRAIDELTNHGVPIQQDVENGARVYWSVPSTWLPGARALSGEQVRACARLLARLPRSRTRDGLLIHLLGPAAGGGADMPAHEAVLEALEDSARDRRACRLRYRSTTTGRLETRHVSVQRIAHGDRTRFVGVCHRSGTLKWFRLDRADVAEPDEREPYRARPDEEVRTFVEGSLDGYKGAGVSERCVFHVRDPEARWVAGNLPSGRMTIKRHENGICVTVHTTAPRVLARYLVGLGEAVRVDTDVLRDHLVELAAQALAGSRATRIEARGGRRNSAAGLR